MKRAIPVPPRAEAAEDREESPEDLTKQVAEFLPSWLTSFVFHLALVLLLALIAFNNSSGQGTSISLDVQTGKVVYGPERLKPAIYSASPVIADGKVYVTNEDGLTSVFRAGAKFELLGENPTDEYTLSTIAVAKTQLFLRTEKYLYAIGK